MDFAAQEGGRFFAGILGYAVRVDVVEV